MLDKLEVVVASWLLWWKMTELLGKVVGEDISWYGVYRTERDQSPVYEVWIVVLTRSG